MLRASHAPAIKHASVNYFERLKKIIVNPDSTVEVIEATE